MSFNPLVDQFATDGENRASRRDGDWVFQKSVTTGWRVGSHFNP